MVRDEDLRKIMRLSLNSYDATKKVHDDARDANNRARYQQEL